MVRALQLSLELWHFYQKAVVVVFNLVGFIIRIRANMFDCCSFRERDHPWSSAEAWDSVYSIWGSWPRSGLCLLGSY